MSTDKPFDEQACVQFLRDFGPNEPESAPILVLGPERAQLHHGPPYWDEELARNRKTVSMLRLLALERRQAGVLDWFNEPPEPTKAALIGRMVDWTREPPMWPKLIDDDVAKAIEHSAGRVPWIDQQMRHAANVRLHPTLNIVMEVWPSCTEDDFGVIAVDQLPDPGDMQWAPEVLAMLSEQIHPPFHPPCLVLAPTLEQRAEDYRKSTEEFAELARQYYAKVDATYRASWQAEPVKGKIRTWLAATMRRIKQAIAPRGT